MVMGLLNFVVMLQKTQEFTMAISICYPRQIESFQAKIPYELIWVVAMAFTKIFESYRIAMHFKPILHIVVFVQCIVCNLLYKHLAMK